MKYMRIITFILLGLCLTVQSAWATRPLERPLTVRQIDGTTLTLTRHLVGGQFLYYTTIDGIPVLRNSKDGSYRYATLTDNLLPECSDMLAHQPSLRSHAENMHLKSHSVTSNVMQQVYLQQLSTQVMKDKSKSRAISSATGLTPYGTSAGGTMPSIGEPLIPVIMVEFPDMAFTDTTTAEKVTRWLNEDGYHDETYARGSIAQYFKDNSNGLFQPHFEVVARITADKPYAYYGANSDGGSLDKNCMELVGEAIGTAADEGVDFSKYIHPETNTVPLVSIYYAGPGEHSAYETGFENYLWAHYRNASYTIGTTKISSYFVGNELLQSYKRDEEGLLAPYDAHTDGIGVFVHEFGHALGLPDFYYTDSNKTTVKDTLDTPYYWSIMDYGQYAFDGYRPVGYSAYERAALGWLNCTDLNEEGLYRLYPLGTEPEGNAQNAATAYILRADESAKEYYLMEYRKPGTWYTSLMGNGLLLTHVIYDETSWRTNTVNNDPSFQRYAIVCADNNPSPRDEEGKFSWAFIKADLWGNGEDTQDFTDSTLPSALLSDGTSLDKPVYGITVKPEGYVSFALKNRELTDILQATTPRVEGVSEIYTMNGQRVSPAKVFLPGVYVKRNPDGTTSKFIVR